jgi:putative flippase GtrA
MPAALRRPAEARRIAAFAVVGGVGFATDALVLSVLVSVFGINIYVARALAFVPATLVTWLLNRSWSFRTHAAPAHQRRQEYLRYFVVQTGGVLVNFAVFALLVAMIPALRSYPVIPLAVGSAFGLIVNYSGARLWVFVARHTSSGSQQ